MPLFKFMLDFVAVAPSLTNIFHFLVFDRLFTLLGPAKGKFRHYNSPRKDNKDSKDAPAREAMPPLQGHAEEVGVLSGRRLQDLIRDRDRNSDLNVSPRAEGYAAVYPADEEPTRPKGLRVSPPVCLSPRI